MLRLRAVSEVGAQVSGATRVPQASPLAGRGTSPLRAGARPHWDHPASREHTCHRAEPSPPRTPAPQSRPQRRAPRRRLYSGGRTKTTQTPLNAKEKGGGSTFPRKQPPHPASEQPRGCPAPPLTSPCPPERAPSAADPLSRPAGRSPPGVRLPSLLQFGGGVWGRRRRRLCRHHSCNRHRSAARRAAEAGGGRPWDPRRCGAGAPQGRAAGSRRREARSERGASHPRPGSHNFAARVGAGCGRREARAGRGRRGGERLRSGRDWHLGGPRGRGSGRRGAGGEEVCTAREVRGG